MDRRCLIDTSVLIQAQRGDSAVAKTLLKIINPTISRITACELVYGSANKRELAINMDVLKLFRIVELNEEISFEAYSLISKYGLKIGLGIADALVLATCIKEDLPLWTLDIKHFKPIKEIELFSI